VYNREEFGHWEGDLIIGKGQQSAMATLVERSSRYLILIPLAARNSKTVVNAFIEAFSNLPSYMRKSLTYDQGSEMAEHERLRDEIGIDVYFADAGQPQQRGTNENTNGLIREFFPKGIDLNQFNIEDTQEVQEILNQRPKKVLKYATAKEAFSWATANPKAELSEFKRQNNIF
jgi:IS30 family transposase